MRKRIPGVAVAVMLFAIPAAAFAEINGTDSVEWMTVDCEMVVKGRVAGVVKSPGRGDQVYEDVTVSISEVIKSDYKGTTITFRWMTYKGKEHATASNWQESRHEMLFFLIKGDPEKEDDRYEGCWTLRTRRTAVIDLDNPGKSAISADFKVLKESEKILRLVRERVKYLKENPPRIKPSKIGIELSMWRGDPGYVTLDVPTESEAFGALWMGSSCYLRAPADPRYKDLAMKLCRSENAHERAKGARMLRSYPDKDVINMLREMLKDKATSRWGGSSGKTVRIVYFVRKVAYESLQTLGEKVEKPVLEEEPGEKEQEKKEPEQNP